jgi:hypothetical protein
MPDCDYCDSHIDESAEDSDQPYLTHLAEEHVDEVTPVDERKLEKKWNGDLEKMRGDYYRYGAATIGAAAAAAVFIIGVGAIAVMGIGSSPPSEDGGSGTEWVYEQGKITVEIGGEQVPPSELNGSEYFYVENETGTWRMSVPSEFRYTVGDALVGIGLITEPTQPTAVSSEYVENPSEMEVEVTVDGESVPLNETVKQGQNITVTVEETA